MELNLVITILDRDRRGAMEALYKSLGLKVALTMLGRGTATAEHLLVNGLSITEKAVMSTLADRAATRRLMFAAKMKMYMDIPGNGVMLSVPVKSVGGGNILAYLTDNRPVDGEKPKLSFSHELIYVVLNEGHSDEVMAAARQAGATGGTVLSAKGTGLVQAEQFLGISLADEKEIILIVARAQDKAGIMKAIIGQAGAHTRAGAFCFSLPVSSVVGLRRVEAEGKGDAEKA